MTGREPGRLGGLAATRHRQKLAALGSASPAREAQLSAAARGSQSSRAGLAWLAESARSSPVLHFGSCRPALRPGRRGRCPSGAIRQKSYSVTPRVRKQRVMLHLQGTYGSPNPSGCNITAIFRPWLGHPLAARQPPAGCCWPRAAAVLRAFALRVAAKTKKRPHDLDRQLSHPSYFRLSFSRSPGPVPSFRPGASFVVPWLSR